MANAPGLTARDVERRIGVSGLKEAQWTRAVYASAAALRTLLTVAGVGGAAVFTISMGVTLLAFPAVLLALGLPVAQAKGIVARRALKQGYSLGVTIGLFGHDFHFFSRFIDRTTGAGGVAPGYMSGVFQNAFNSGLVIGYAAALRLTNRERARLREALTGILVEDAKKKGHKLYMQSWSDRQFVVQHAVAFRDRYVKD